MMKNTWMLWLAAILCSADQNNDTSISCYDLKSDPYEKYDISDTDLESVIEILTDRVTFWNQFIQAPEVPDKSTMKTTFKTYGGVVPWIETSFEPIEVEQIYFYEGAPDLIFVFVDDWGYNDFGLRSTYLSWTSPNIDELAANGILLENYYSQETCSPARGALLTGRYPLRLGLWQQHEEAELPLSEVTLAQELQSAGYMNYMVGKWHLGYSTTAHVPTSRGFHSFYGFYNGYVDYWEKTYGTYLDLHDSRQNYSDTLVVDEAETSSELHNALLLQRKVEKVIGEHVSKTPERPMFIYYALQLIHEEWTAPEGYVARCAGSNSSTPSEYYHYCAFNIMLDEAIGNLTCTLKEYDRYENTILMIVSDNGGVSTMPGNSYPFKGHKGSYYRGGVSATAIIHSPLLPHGVRGTTYSGLTHVTDWLPTIMRLATNNSWSGSYIGATLDGYNMWESILSDEDSPRTEIVHYVDGNGSAVILLDHIKYLAGVISNGYDDVEYVFTMASTASRSSCSNPSLVDPDTTEDTDLMSGLKPDGLDFTYAFAVLVLVSLALLALLHYQHYWSGQSDSNASLNQVVGCVSEATREGDESTPLRAGAVSQQPPRGGSRSKAR